MTRVLLDVNVVLALVDPQHTHHPAAHAWAARTSGVRWLNCPIVQNGALRIASQTAYSRRLGGLAQVRAVLQAFCADPRHEFCPDDVSLLDDAHLAHVQGLTAKDVSDVYLLALARHHGARLATFDRRVAADAVPGGAAWVELVGA